MENSIWFKNPIVLIEKDNLLSFFPDKENTIEENINAIVRLSIYIFLTLLVCSMNIKYIMLPVLALILTYVYYEYYLQKEPFCDNEHKNLSPKYTTPTVDNPFMNYNHNTDNYNKPPSYKAFLYNDSKSKRVRKKIEDSFNEKLYRDAGDIYAKRNGQREFYSIAYNGIPDQTSFAKWLYTWPGATCKESSMRCGSHTGSMI